MILRNVEQSPGFIVGGHNINNLRFADNTVLITESEALLQELLDKVIEESRKKGLTINCKKTECLVVRKREGNRCTFRNRRCKYQTGEQLQISGKYCSKGWKV